MTTQTREFEFTSAQFDKIRLLAKERAGIHLTEAKFDLVYSRLARRIRALRLRSFADYLGYLAKNDEDEAREMINALTTNVTAFFRENHHFDFLADAASKRIQASPIKVWCCASSTGEEPYSIAMTLMEARRPDFRILASDLDTVVLRTAAAGVYPEARVEGVPPEQLRRWFMTGCGDRDGTVRVRPELQTQIRFRQINLMNDWPIKGPLDAIFCRNVIIYFERSTQIALFHRFADLLRPGGFLFLGHSESVQDEPRLRSVGRTIYERVE